MNLVINLNKERGITSHTAVSRVKEIFKAKKAGHAGTLDPLATGVLLVCLDEAVKITSYLSELPKEYDAVMKLGETTDTFDSEGSIIKRTENFQLSSEDIKKVVESYIGNIIQTPPIYSAIKIAGKPLYKYARSGISKIPSPRKVTIYRIEIIDFVSPFLRLKIQCSKGTYIRSLCNDIGMSLHVGAHLTSLIRTKIGDFTIENSATIDEVLTKEKAQYSINSALKHLPEIVFTDKEVARLKNGNPITIKLDKHFSNVSSDIIKMKDKEGNFFGLGKISSNKVKPQRLFKL
ncbi:MAG: tRNA pseudouridine(55) synthase TruB [Thermodesulfovibrionales bacterium]|nr:tRNA pseudouridine(55) synthase TruB [Thermodesulfovibrionales bacterium]